MDRFIPLIYSGPLAQRDDLELQALLAPEPVDLFLVDSSIIEAILMALPLVVESNWKSVAHNTFGASASIGGIEDAPTAINQPTPMANDRSKNQR